MLKSLFELYYNQSSYEPMSGGGYGVKNNSNSVLGSQTAGSNNIRHIYDIENSDYYDINDDNNDDDIDDEDKLNISAKLNTSHNVYKSDPGGRKDNATLVTNNHYSIFEDNSHHKTHAMQGISPRLTYRTNNNTKGPAFGVQSSATYIRNKPGKISGTQYGTSRSHKLLTDIEDESIFNLDDMIDQMERSMVRHNKATKQIISIVEEYIR